MRFFLGYLWVILISALLYRMYPESLIWWHCFFINFGLNSIYVALFIKPYRLQQRDILKQVLLLITLQIFLFLIVLVVFLLYHLPLINMVYVVFVFLGVLSLQVREQILFLKSI
jgi:hypothetical protein